MTWEEDDAILDVAFGTRTRTRKMITYTTLWIGRSNLDSTHPAPFRIYMFRVAHIVDLMNQLMDHARDIAFRGRVSVHSPDSATIVVRF